ncbi:M23 family metallopeptidase [Chengkuizengella axinellae]|uniref:M23 family metallopeptidase n=1 Tax=Chengkuizengella axinellae TaxID=3064388 RepID=A0ABT9IT48_9BACL|nr:M23 family metallopeptidase [Chengkuizengella sp. 2205SS18-9]MDP5272524.1 M23 family metallopeptidase [Chengkuizengella sp. 2205SS18-9]
MFSSIVNPSLANKKEEPSIKQIYEQRQQLYEEISLVTGIPWFYLAAIDQYERSLSIANPKQRPIREGLIGIHISKESWVGYLNPDIDDSNIKSILFFNGVGRDGSGDGLAEWSNDQDVLYTITQHILKYGLSKDDLHIALWEYYQNSRSVKRIEQFATIYEKYGTLDLHKHAFPVPLRSDYSYRSTWGAGRSFGGFRIHEGTDIFARHGVPVRSTCYGVIEVMGWNRYGGWRVGIRDLNNVYHYYAHLSGFNKEVEQGDIVEPGQVLGWVGSSGYGKPGTQGKFSPHLHYGLYRDNGYSEWSFDPYHYLRKWEREERKNRK